MVTRDSNKKNTPTEEHDELDNRKRKNSKISKSSQNTLRQQKQNLKEEAIKWKNDWREKKTSERKWKDKLQELKCNETGLVDEDDMKEILAQQGPQKSNNKLLQEDVSEALIYNKLT